MQRNMMRSMNGQMPGAFPAMRQMPVPTRKGNLLANLFQRGGNAASGNAAAGFSRGTAASPSLLQSIANPEKINSFLSQTQQVLGTAKQFGPMVQQYGPVVKNIPSMWKMYRAMKDAPEAEQEPKIVEASVQPSKEPPAKTVKPQKKKIEGKSVPKMYIP